MSTVNSTLSQETRDALKAANPGVKLHALRVSGEIIVVKKPEKVHWERLEQDKGDGPEAAITLVRECVVYPDEPAFDKLLNEKYAIYQPIGDFIGKLVGLERVEELGEF